jgi:uncharacterized protein
MSMRTNENSSKHFSRREFLAGAVGAAALGAGIGCSRNSGSSESNPMPYRTLGRTDMKISLIGMGGGSTMNMIKDYQDKLALVDLARGQGINWFDSSANYGRESEGCYGDALQDHRKEVYFSTKYETEHKPDRVMKDVERSLKRLRTDYIDIAHMHAIKDMKEVEAMFSSGALETLVKLKEQKIIRYIGVTSHNHPPALAEALRRFEFDVCLMATNASKVPFLFEFDPKADSSFEDSTLPLANKQGIGVIAFKILGQRRLIRKADEKDKASTRELIRYGLSLPVHGILLGMNTPEQVVSNCDLAANFTPMSVEEKRELNGRLAASANELTLHYLNPAYVDDGGSRAHLA